MKPVQSPVPSSHYGTPLLRILALLTFAILIAVLSSLGTYWYISNQMTQQANQQIYQPAPSINPQESVSPQATQDETANWKTFKAKMEDFTLKYPATWRIDDASSGNCGHASLNGSNCRDRFYITSPDNLVQIKYIIRRDDNSDKLQCGAQSVCQNQIVDKVEELVPPLLGKVYLVTEDKQVFFHKPLSQETMPRVGSNKHSDFMIFFTLPSKLGGRFSLELDIINAENLSKENAFNLDSVKIGLQILKSLSY